MMQQKMLARSSVIAVVVPIVILSLANVSVPIFSPSYLRLVLNSIL